jgi:hypothetical protein
MMARLILPDPEGLAVRFGPGPRGRATVGSGRDAETFDADAAGRLTIPLRRKWHKPGVEVVLSRPPQRLMLLLD